MADATSAALGDPLLPAGAGAGAALNTAALARDATTAPSILASVEENAFKFFWKVV